MNEVNNILNEIKNGKHNIVLNAVAGAGKTTILLKALENVPRSTVMAFVAYNKSISEEIKYKVRNIYHGIIPDNIKVFTCHALGKEILESNFTRGNKPVLNDWKYMTRFNEIKNPDMYLEFSSNDIRSYNAHVKNLLNYARYHRAKTIEDIETVAKRYGIMPIDNEYEIVLELMEWGKEHIDTIDYTDMIWLPLELGLKNTEHKFDMVLIDEAQDLSIMQQDLIYMTFKENTRFIAAGDRNQCINAWQGADPEAFKKYASRPNTIEMPLNMTRRCPKNVVKLAQRIVPEIEAMPDAKDGEVNYEVNPFDAIKPNSLILCRNNAPLIKLYNAYIERGRKASFSGDFKTGLLEELGRSNKELLSSNFNEDGVFPDLYRSLLSDAEETKKTNSLDERSVYQSSEISERLDTIKSLEILAAGLTTKAQLIEKINGVNINDSVDCVRFSTIHRAKGLTYDHVYILGYSLIPSRLAVQDWEIEAERNLEYVALTRAKESLNFISESKFPVDDIYSNPEKIMKIMSEIKDNLKTLDSLPKGKRGNINRDFSGTTVDSKKRHIGARKFNKFL